MKLKLTYKNNNPTGRYSSFHSKSIHVKLNGKEFAIISEKSVLDNSDRLKWGIQICIFDTDKVNPNCKWKWVFMKFRSDNSEDIKNWLETNIETLYKKYEFWMIDFDKSFKEDEVMRVKKKCTECGKLKSMSDFLPCEGYGDKKALECKDCFEETQYGENNSKINNNPIISTMSTLKEKRAAEAAAKAAGTTSAPVAETQTTETATETVAPKVEKPKAVKPVAKVGDTTAEGDTVVGEKKVPGQRGRKAAEEKVIEQLDMEGVPTGVKFNTLQEAADAVGKSKAYVLDGLRGWSKSVGGFKWRYEGEELFIREKKVKTDAEKEFIKAGKKDKAPKVEDIPVPGDLDYDAELHAPKPVVEEEVLDAQDESVFEASEEEPTEE